MSDDINLKITGDSSGGEKALATLERRYDSLEAKLKSLRRTTKSANSESIADTDALSASIGKLTTSYGGAITSAMGLQRIMSGVAQTQLQSLERMERVAEKLRESNVKFEVQTGMTGPKAQASRKAVAEQLRKTPVTDLTSGYGIQQQMAGSGFNAKDIESGALAGAVFEISAATNMVGKDAGDPKEIVKSISQTLKGFGIQEPTAADVRKFGGALTEIFDSSDVTFPDLKFLAPKAPTLRNFGVNQEVGTAAFASLVDVMGPERAGTGLAGYISRTSTAANTKERVKALDSIGLKPEDVQMTPGGKDFFQVSDILRERVKQLPEAERNNFFAKMYGDEAAPAASFVLSDEGYNLIKKRADELKAPDIMERNLETYRKSAFARNQRLKIDEELAQSERIDMQPITWGESRQAGRTAIEQSRAMVDRTMGGTWAGMTSQLALSLTQFVGETGATLASAAGLNPRDVGIGANQMNEKVVEKLDGIHTTMKQQQRPQLAPARPANPEAAR